MNLQLNSFGTQVLWLQRSLQELGYGTFVPTGFYGTKTKQAVTSFQVDNKLTPTGIFGTIEWHLMTEALSKARTERMYQTALSILGTDITPADEVPDDVACMQTVDTLYKKAFGNYMNGKNCIISTYSGWQFMMNSPKFARTDTPTRGCILVYPTGTGNGALKNGHIFVVGDKNLLMSNSSLTGLFTQNFTKETAKTRYTDIGGFKPYYFKLI